MLLLFDGKRMLAILPARLESAGSLAGTCVDGVADSVEITLIPYAEP